MFPLKRDRDAIFNALGSKTRLKILDVLTHNKGEELSVYRISKLSRVKGDAIRKSLPILIKVGLVDEKRYGPAKLYSINKERKIAKILTEFLLKL